MSKLYSIYHQTMLVALSGGCDSVALLLMLLERGTTVHAAHCNFHLRGAESDRDEAFVRQLCRERGVELHVAHFDTLAYASLHHLSVETAARNLRYHYFEQLRRDLSLDAIAVAHHRDDQAETVLMHLLRGSGLHGLTGMRPQSGHIVRPLLHLSRKQLEDYLREKHQPYVTDSTNLERDATRNRIRLDVMPLLEAIYPHAAEAIARCADHLAEAEKVVEEAVLEERGKRKEERGMILHPLSCASPNLYLHYRLSPLGFTPAQTEAIARNLDAPTGTVYESATHTLLFDRGQLVVDERREPLRPMVIPEPGTYVLSDGRRMSVTITERTPDFQPSRQPLTATLDADTVSLPLTIRTALPGDRFRPYGMAGSKLVSDYLTDRHVALTDKRRQLVVAQADGSIVWLPGHRTASPQAVTEATRRVMKLMITKKDNDNKGQQRQ